MDLVRDVLDKQLVDAKQRRLGKVDGLVLALAPGEPPTVAAIELGPRVLARRLSPRVGRWTVAIAPRLGVPHDDPYRIPGPKVRAVGLAAEGDVPTEGPPPSARQRW